MTAPAVPPHLPTPPATVADLQAWIAAANAAGAGLNPVGGATEQHSLLPSKPSIWPIDTARLCGVIDYPARDMTITVQAGITLAALRSALAAEGQWLPPAEDLPLATTLGGALAANSAGPRRLGFGTWRDYVIGIQFVSGAGELIQAGGRVVKNVAGYDLAKLMIGSWGTLGLITQVSLKVLPRPEVETWTRRRLPLKEAESAAAWLQGTRTRPIGLLARWTGSEVELALGLAGLATAVGWQRQHLAAEWAAFAEASWGAGPDGLAATGHAAASGTELRVGTTPSRAWDCAQVLKAGLPPDSTLTVALGVGTVTAATAQTLTPERVDQLRQAIAARAGTLVLTRFPLELAQVGTVWGPERGDWDLMRKIKQELDPKNRWNPGRHFTSVREPA